MIKLNVMCKDHRIDIDFPCSEMILQSKMMEIHSDNPDLPEYLTGIQYLNFISMQIRKRFSVC